MDRGRIRRPIGLKRYLVYTATALEDLKRESDYQFDYELTEFEKLVIVLEDRRYFKHRGFDWRSLARELVKVISLRRHGGGSTIEMQFVRTVTERYEKTIGRKFQEVVLALLLGYHLDKLTILRSYLNRAYFGTSLWGARPAARAIFAQPLQRLTNEQSAQLAAMLVYPRPRHPSAAWRAKVERRARYGLRLLGRLQDSFK